MTTSTTEFQNSLLNSITDENLIKLRDSAESAAQRNQFQELIESRGLGEKGELRELDPTLDYLDADQESFNEHLESATLFDRDSGVKFGIANAPIMLKETFIRQDNMDKLIEDHNLDTQVMYGQGLVVHNAKLLAISVQHLREVYAQEVDKDGNLVYGLYEGDVHINAKKMKSALGKAAPRDLSDDDIECFPKACIDGHGVWQVKDQATYGELLLKKATHGSIPDDQWFWEVHPELITWQDVSYDKMSYDDEGEILRYLQARPELIPEGYSLVSGLDGCHKGYRYALLLPNVFAQVAAPTEENEHEVKEVNVWSHKEGFVMGYFQLLTA